MCLSVLLEPKHAIFQNCDEPKKGTSSPVLNRNGENGHLCMVPDLSKNPSNFSLFIMVMGILFYCFLLLFETFLH